MFVFALLISCLFTSAMAVYAWRRRRISTARTVMWMMIGLSWWTLTYGLLIAHVRHPDLVPTVGGDPLFWFRVMFMGAVLIPASFLVFILQYTGYRQSIGPRLILLLAVMPLITVMAALTDGRGHDLFMAGFVPGQGKFLGGPAFWLHTLYSYLLILVSYSLLIWFIIQNRRYRKQALLFLAGSSTALVANVITVLRLGPESVQSLDLSPFGFAIAALFMTLNIRREGFLDVMPIAHSVVFEHLADALLVTDSSGRLLDRNPAARRMFGEGPGGRFRGLPVTSLVPGLITDGKTVTELELLLPEGPDTGVTGEARRRVLSVRQAAFHNRKGSVRGYIYGFRDVTRLKQVEQSLRDQLEQNENLRKALKEESIRDPLTGLFNRRWLDETLDREIPRCLREQSELSLAVVDLDHFKAVNDTWGHDVGDVVLVRLARLLQDGCRRHDVAARFGGEEFVLVLPGLGPAEAAEVVERLLSEFRERDFGPKGPRRITFSAGVAAVPGHARDRDTLFRMADRALYEAKSSGRNRVVILPPEESVTPGTD